MTPITDTQKKKLKRSAAIRKGKQIKALELDQAIASAVAKDPY